MKDAYLLLFIFAFCWTAVSLIAIQASGLAGNKGVVKFWTALFVVSTLAASYCLVRFISGVL